MAYALFSMFGNKPKNSPLLDLHTSVRRSPPDDVTASAQDTGDSSDEKFTLLLLFQPGWTLTWPILQYFIISPLSRGPGNHNADRKHAIGALTRAAYGLGAEDEREQG